jgi:uncharacterized membrane protein YjjP (DUF1212 family)
MKQPQKTVLMLAMRAGQILLRSGSEVYRVEDTINRICHACDMPYVECFVTTTGIIVTLGQDEDDGGMKTLVKTVKRIGIDLEKISRVNTFVREFTAHKHSVEEGFAILDEIEQIKPFKLPARLVGVMLVAAFFAMMNGGSPFDGVCALGCAVVTYLLYRGIDRLHINRFITIFVSCLVCALLASLCFAFGWGDSLSAIIVGSITVYLPGVAITNAVRDMLSGDMLAGVARVAESFLVAVAIAAGAGVLIGVVPLGGRVDVLTAFPLPLGFVFAALGTIGISIFINIPRRLLLLASLPAACSWVTLQLLMFNGSPHVLAVFAAACVVALIAEVFTHITREAAPLFIIPAIFPLVPGLGLYNTMLDLMQGDLIAAAATGSEAIFVAGGIALALLVVISLTRIVRVIFAQVRGLIK